MKDLKIIGREAEAAAKELARLGITERNNALMNRQLRRQKF